MIKEINKIKEEDVVKVKRLYILYIIYFYFIQNLNNR